MIYDDRMETPTKPAPTSNHTGYLINVRNQSAPEAESPFS
ncbi:hypothetical protein PROPEN_04382 [Proteus penneri ATCC 35198]|nr:hypothetical protein PROPEN_04382 [Proteus penneri ATCC 35198]